MLTETKIKKHVRYLKTNCITSKWTNWIKKSQKNKNNLLGIFLFQLVAKATFLIFMRA